MATGNSISLYLENMIIQHFLKTGAAVAQPSNIYVSLHTADPTDTNTAGTEASFTGYARQVATFVAPSNGSTSNTADILFPANGDAATSTITYVGIYDALTNGNLLFHGALSSAVSLPQNAQFKFPAGQLTVALD